MFAIPSLDNLAEDELTQLADQWFDEREDGLADIDTIDSAYHVTLPRNVFLKSLPSKSTVLDVGAGDGSLALQKNWPYYQRLDLRLFALSLDVGVHFDSYEGYEIKNFETDPDVFCGQNFDAIICAHFIEHMKDPRATIEFFARKVGRGGRVYMEWPHPFTKRLPGRDSLAAKGIRTSTFNFFDDYTHVEPWTAEHIASLFAENGFALEAGGRVYMPWVGGQMRDHARAQKCETRMSLAAWAAFGWAQYVVLNRF